MSIGGICMEWYDVAIIAVTGVEELFVFSSLPSCGIDSVEWCDGISAEWSKQWPQFFVPSAASLS